jgi:hypothetical protein
MCASAHRVRPEEACGAPAHGKPDFRDIGEDSQILMEPDDCCMMIFNNRQDS